MTKPETITVTLAELREGLTTLERLKSVNIEGYKMHVAQTRHNVRHKLQLMQEERENIEARHAIEHDGRRVPGCESDDFDPQEFSGWYEEEVEYRAGDVVIHQNVFYRARIHAPEEKPARKAESWETIGKVTAGSVYVHDMAAYLKEVRELEREEVEIYVHPIPAEVIVENEDVTPEMIWMPMCTFPDPEPEEEEEVPKASKNGKAKKKAEA